jgi:hypothetical protein
MEWIALAGIIIFIILLSVIVTLAKGKGTQEAENKRKGEILKTMNQVHQRYGQVMDWVTNKRFNFYEMAKEARTVSDYTDIANKLLEINAEHISADTGASKKSEL